MLASPLPCQQFNFLGALPPVGFEVYKFLEGPPLIFSEPPIRVSKNFWSPPSISSCPLVILNELSPKEIQNIHLQRFFVGKLICCRVLDCRMQEVAMSQLKSLLHQQIETNRHLSTNNFCQFFRAGVMQATRAKLLPLRESLAFASLARMRRTKIDWVIRNLRTCTHSTSLITYKQPITHESI